MSVPSSFDITALLLGLEERLSEQLAAVTTRLDAILPAYAKSDLNVTASTQRFEARKKRYGTGPAEAADAPVSVKMCRHDVERDDMTGPPAKVADAPVSGGAEPEQGTSGEEPGDTAPVASAGGESAAQVGLTVVATLAHNAVLVACQQLEREGAQDAEKLQRALDLLQPPLSAQPAAQAYDLVREVRKGCAPHDEDIVKFAALAVREALVLQICCTRGSMSDIGFESALEHAFQRQLGDELRSQLHNSRAAICRLTLDRTKFDRAVPKLFSSTLSSEEVQVVFSTYAACSECTMEPKASGTSKASQQAKSRRKKGQKVQAAEGAAREPLHDADHEEGAVWPLQAMEPWRLQPTLEPQWLDIDPEGKVCPVRSSWDGESVARTFHPADKMAAGGMETWSSYFSYEAEEPLPAREVEVKPIQWLVSNGCIKCGSEDSHSWSCIGGVWYCEHCWGAQLYGQRHRRQPFDAIIIPAFQQLHVLKATGMERHEPGGRAERFYSIDADPVGQRHLRMEVSVVEKDLLEVAEQSGYRAVLVCAGEDAGPLCGHAPGSQQELVDRASTFQMALEVTWPDTKLPTPEFGGFYVPEVLVYRRSDGRAIKPFRISMVYDAPLIPPTSVSLADEYLELMRYRIHNVLRMCNLKEHDEIVLGAWGCDGPVGPYTERIAELFREALLGRSDVSRRFRRVTFAISPSDTLEVFQKVFKSC